MASPGLILCGHRDGITGTDGVTGTDLVRARGVTGTDGSHRD